MVLYIVQWSQIIMILFNSLSGQYLNTPIDTLFPEVLQFAPLIAGKSIIWVIAVNVFAISCLQLVSNVLNVFLKLGLAGFVEQGLPGLAPITQWLLAVWITFNNTEWAWRHPSLAMMLLCPGFCLINSKMIICNVTNMQSEWHSWTFLWFLLFPLN